MREGTGVAIGSIALGAMAGLLIGNAGKATIDGMQEWAEAREEAAYRAAIANALDDAELLGKIAVTLVHELATARATNDRLERALQQRQAYIDRMRSK